MSLTKTVSQMSALELLEMHSKAQQEEIERLRAALTDLWNETGNPADTLLDKRGTEIRERVLRLIRPTHEPDAPPADQWTPEEIARFMTKTATATIDGHSVWCMTKMPLRRLDAVCNCRASEKSLG